VALASYNMQVMNTGASGGHHTDFLTRDWRPMNLKIIAFTLAAALLAGCAQIMGTPPQTAGGATPPADDMAPTETRNPATAATVPSPSPQPRPDVNGSDALAGEEAVAGAHGLPGQAAAQATEKPDFSVLIGRDFTGVQALLGPADRIEEAAPGRTWEYRDGACVLAVRFYPDLKTLDYRVLSYGIDNEEPTDSQNTDDDGFCRSRFAAKLRTDR